MAAKKQLRWGVISSAQIGLNQVVPAIQQTQNGQVVWFDRDKEDRDVGGPAFDRDIATARLKLREEGMGGPIDSGRTLSREALQARTSNPNPDGPGKEIGSLPRIRLRARGSSTMPVFGPASTH